VKATEPTKIAIVGLGKIAQDQHIPSIGRHPGFSLSAIVTRGAGLPGFDHFTRLDAMLAARPDVTAVALCVPPQVRFGMAWAALSAGRDVLLEKPPGATVAEVQALADRARAKGRTLFATWHSRFSPGVAQAKAWLAERRVTGAAIVWREDVRKWHPGQAWIWDAGGMGVFDPGINALSILTEIMPTPVHLTAAELEFPENRDTPIAARLAFADAAGAAVSADFDWRQTGPQTWDIAVDTDRGSLRLSAGGAALEIDGQAVDQPAEAEYDGIYARFAALLAAGTSDVDASPLVHVADAFMLGRRIVTDPFHD
jgi:D-galactose 1-dehydrogenase